MTTLATLAARADEAAARVDALDHRLGLLQAELAAVQAELAPARACYAKAARAYADGRKAADSRHRVRALDRARRRARKLAADWAIRITTEDPYDYAGGRCYYVDRPDWIDADADPCADTGHYAIDWHEVLGRVEAYVLAGQQLGLSPISAPSARTPDQLARDEGFTFHD